MKSVTHLVGGPVFDVARTNDQAPYFMLKKRGERQKHAEVWRNYYDLVTSMAWPDPATVTELAPVLEQLSV